MPSVPVHHEHLRDVVSINFLDPLHRHLGNFRFFLLALRIPVLEFRKQLRGAGIIRAEQQLERGVGFFHAAGRIQERGKLVHHVDSAHAAPGLHERGVQRLDSGQAAFLQALETPLGEQPVLGSHLHEVGQRAERHQVEHFGRRRHPETFVQRAYELVRNAHATKFRIGVGIAFLVRVQKNVARRERVARRLVVVDDHHVHSQFLRMGNLVVRGDARIDGHHVASARFVHLVDRGNREPVTIAETVRQAPVRLDSELRETPRQKRHRGHPVQVVVTEDENLLFLFAHVENPAHGIFHALDAPRRKFRVATLVHNAARGNHVAHAPGDKEPCHQMGNLQFPRES